MNPIKTLTNGSDFQYLRVKVEVRKIDLQHAMEMLAAGKPFRGLRKAGAKNKPHK